MSFKHNHVVRAAELYYLQNLTQEEIARILGVSRPTVSRLLVEAKDSGVVEIKVNSPVSLDSELSNQLRKKLNIRDVLVVDAEESNDMNMMDKVGQIAARYFESIIKPKCVVGISFGRALRALVDKLEEVDVRGIEVVQTAGGLGGGDSQIDGQKLAYEMSEKLHANYQYIHAPAILHDANTVVQLKREPSIIKAFEFASEANVYLFGIGSLSEHMGSLERAGYLNEEQIKELKSQGAVGHILAKIIRADGSEILEFNRRVLSIDLSNLKNAEWSIGIAAQSDKADAILAAIRGGYLNVLITSKSCAIKLINLLNEK